MAHRPFIAFSLGFLLLVPLAGASNPPDQLSRLLSNSPFGLSRTGAGAGANATDPLEFRGVLDESGNKLFSIYETATRRSTWVELNDPVNGFSVKGYNPANESVIIEYQNRSLTLAIKRAAPVAQTAPLPPAPGALVGSPTNPSMPTLQNPVDQQRLQQIQEEIRRRRALRQQAAPPPGTSMGEAGPQAVPTNTTGPQFSPSNSPGPVPVPAKP